MSKRQDKILSIKKKKKIEILDGFCLESKYSLILVESIPEGELNELSAGRDLCPKGLFFF